MSSETVSTVEVPSSEELKVGDKAVVRLRRGVAYLFYIRTIEKIVTTLSQPCYKVVTTCLSEDAYSQSKPNQMVPMVIALLGGGTVKFHR